jgi:hypothetical protein
MLPVRRLVKKHGSWRKHERQLYGGQEVAIIGDRDHAGKILVELRSGDLAGERRWIDPSELEREDSDGT